MPLHVTYITGALHCIRSVKAGGCFKASGWGGAICDAMKPHEGDVVVEGKRGLCGFASTNLVRGRERNVPKTPLPQVALVCAVVKVSWSVCVRACAGAPQLDGAAA